MIHRPTIIVEVIGDVDVRMTMATKFDYVLYRDMRDGRYSARSKGDFNRLFRQIDDEHQHKTD